MLLEINFIPRKEKTMAFQSTVFLIVAAVVLVTVIATVFVFVQLNQKVDAVNQKLNRVNAQIEAEVRKAEGKPFTTSGIELEKLVSWVKTFPQPMSKVIARLQKGLPAQAYIQSTSLNQQGTMKMVASFASRRDASVYLEKLEALDMVANVTLSSLNSHADKNQAGSSIGSNKVYDATFDIAINYNALK